MKTITATELANLIKSGQSINLIDVRTPVEYREVHIAEARNVPLDQLEPSRLPVGNNGHPLYVICRSGSRGQQACVKLLAAGTNNVVNVEGGTLAWVSAGLPVVRGQKAMSLERQVRIAAGALVLLGSGLTLLHPGFLALPAIMGAGLMFAGITDTCGMGMLLARMPWNQVKATTPSCCALKQG